MKNKLKIIFFILLSAAVLSLIESFYYQVKAEVAQLMLENAWQASQSEPMSNIKPWPWADTWPVFKLSLHQKLNSEVDTYHRQGEKRETFNTLANYIVLSDASGESLAFGPGLLSNHIFPGDLGNSLIAAHRDTHFASLASIRTKDEIHIEFKDGSAQRFIIDTVDIIDSTLEAPLTDIDEVRLTLVTCYPFDRDVQETSLRLLVSGKAHKF